MEREFAIVCDSAADLPKEYFIENNVEYVPLGFTMNSVNYLGEDGKSISAEEFYAALRGGAMPTTYQVTSEQAKTHIEKYLKKGLDVLVLTFSSALSGTAGSFFVAARELKEKYPERKVLVVDSLCASLGEGLLLDYVVKRADKGCSIDEAYEYAETLKGRICHNFTVDNLFHLKRGGRVSSMTAVIGSILKIKPIMQVSNDGKLIVVGKELGRRKSLSQIFENMQKKIDEKDDGPIIVGHADSKADAEKTKGWICEKYPNREVWIEQIGAVIGSHSGAGTIALFFKGTR